MNRYEKSTCEHCGEVSYCRICVGTGEGVGGRNCGFCGGSGVAGTTPDCGCYCNEPEPPFDTLDEKAGLR